jgi:hypothetical protein
VQLAQFLLNLSWAVGVVLLPFDDALHDLVEGVAEIIGIQNLLLNSLDNAVVQLCHGHLDIIAAHGHPPIMPKAAAVPVGGFAPTAVPVASAQRGDIAAAAGAARQTGKEVLAFLSGAGAAPERPLRVADVCLFQAFLPLANLLDQFRIYDAQMRRVEGNSSVICQKKWTQCSMSLR